MINYDIKFLTHDEALQIKNNDFKSFKYETKKRLEESVYDSSKRGYCERRGGLWRTPHPRQSRKLETKLRDKSIISCEWTTDSLITLVFSSGVITYLTVKPSALDVTQILFDRYLIGKLSGQTVTNVAICKSLILLAHNDRTVTLVTFGKTCTNLPCRVTDRDPHIQSIELGGTSRRTERYISTNENCTGTKVLVWSVNVLEPAPWSPIAEDHANLHLYTINGHQIKLSTYHQLENETLSAELSYKGDNIIHIVEQINCHKNGINLEWLRYDVNKTDECATKLSCSRDSATNVSISTPVRLVRRSPCDSRLLIACIDGTLHVIHCTAGIIHTIRAGFIATDIRWAGDLIIAAEEGGRIQCFDRALSLLHLHSKCLELSSYLRDSRRMQVLAARNAKNGPRLLVTFSGGPLALLHITHPRLITTWIRMNRCLNAVALLSAMDWEKEGTECLWAINRLVCAALRNKTDVVSDEAIAQGALGTYLAPRAPHRASASRYAPPVHDLARKFFHHLLRRGRIEKALSLAVDLMAWDLFVDARWAARRLHLHALAHEASTLAQLHAITQQSGSECSGSCSCSESYTESEDESSPITEIKTKPPPLPRVTIPNLPTMVQVPITHIEPISTNSIRPNLHQYLEKDNSIWTTDIQENYSNNYPKSILNTNNLRWNSMDMLSNYKGQKVLTTIKETPKHAIFDLIPRNDEINANFYQKELKEEVPDRTNTLYRYQHNNNYHPSTSLRERAYKMDSDVYKQLNRTVERNKVKFSDTVTIAVVSEPDTERELAASLPLCPPHKYLTAFTPQQNVQRNVQNNVQRNVEYNVQRNTEQNIQRNMNDILQRNVEFNVHRSMENIVQRNVDNIMQRNVQDNVKRNVEYNFQRNMNDVVQRNIQNNLQRNVEYNLQRNTEHNTQRNMEHNTQRNTEHNSQRIMNDIVQRNMQNNVQRNIEYNLQRNTEHNTQWNTEHNTQRNTEDNSQRNMNDIVQRNVQQNVENNVQRNVEYNMQRNTEHNTQRNMNDIVQRNTEYNSQRNVDNNIAPAGTTLDYVEV